MISSHLYWLNSLYILLALYYLTPFVILMRRQHLDNTTFCCVFSQTYHTKEGENSMMRSWSSSYIEVQEKEVNSYHVQVTSFSGIMNKGLAHHHQAGPIGQTHDQPSILEGTMGAFSVHTQVLALGLPIDWHVIDFERPPNLCCTIMEEGTSHINYEIVVAGSVWRILCVWYNIVMHTISVGFHFMVYKSIEIIDKTWARFVKCTLDWLRFVSSTN